MAILGGSPLGLIGVRSLAKSSGMSYFNGGDSRNINVSNYNKGTDIYPIVNLGDNKYGSVRTEELNEGTRSLFTGPTVISPYGNVGKLGTDDAGGIGADKYSGINRRELHNDSIYDTSILNILEKLSGTEAGLRPADFAYLKDVGVYPNNRLMVARRFIAPKQDNIFGKNKDGAPLPMAVMIAWKPQAEEFVSISFGEVWENAAGDFTDILNNMGTDFMGKSVGTKIAGGLGGIPLPGFSEALQRKLFDKLGMVEDDPLVPLPSGNPNLIKMAKRRKTVKYGDADSGLKCTISIKFVCEWEQKFISGIDPTVVFQDILAKIATFGTSRSSNYGLSPKFQEKMIEYINKPSKMISDFIVFIKQGLNVLISDITKKINNLNSSSSLEEASKKSISDGLSQGITNLSKLVNEGGNVISRTIQKYKIELQGVARALTGLPSTPWHVTIGNPLRPTFCSGDMYMESDLVLTLGSTLSFNDLPTNIKAEFTLQNARPWGLQEILGKFNSGSIRVSTTIKDENDRNPGDRENALGKMNIIKKEEIVSNSNPNSNSSNTNNAINIIQDNAIPKNSSSIETQNLNGVTSYNWSVINDGGDNASGIANSLEDANRLISTFSTGGTVIDKTVIASAATTTKEGSAGEQIVADANSNIPTTLQNIRLF